MKHYDDLATVICYTNHVERSSTVRAWRNRESSDPASSIVYDPARIVRLWPGFKKAFKVLATLNLSGPGFGKRLRPGLALHLWTGSAEPSTDH